MENRANPSTEIDLIKLAKSLWLKKILLIKITAIFGILGIVVGLISPKVFTATSTFVPQVSDAKAPSSLGSLAALAGVNLSSMGASSDIPPTLYPKIVASLPFQKRIMDAEVINDGQKSSYKAYLMNQSNAWILIKKYTVGLPALIRGGSNDEGGVVIAPNMPEELMRLSDSDYDVIRILKNAISIRTYQEEGFVSLKVEDSDAEIAAQVAQVAQEVLQEFVISYKIENARVLYEFTEKQWKNKQAEFYRLQDSLAIFNERNQGISSAFLENKKMRLEARYDIANTLYMELAKQKEQAALQLQKDTPIFSVIDPVMVPKIRTSPKRMLLLVLFSFLGFIVAVVFVAVSDPLRAIKKELREGSPDTKPSRLTDQVSGTPL